MVISNSGLLTIFGQSQSHCDHQRLPRGKSANAGGVQPKPTAYYYPFLLSDLDK